MINKKTYLYHAFILRQPKKVILDNSDLTEQEFKTWWENLKEERERLKPIRNFWIKKKCEGVLEFDLFEKHYLNTDSHCHYCKITQSELNKIWEIEAKKGEKLTKRGRGRKLELERITANATYDKLDNLVFACYWCNNAKTDTFTGEEFKKVGKVFREIWNESLK